MEVRDIIKMAEIDYQSCLRNDMPRENLMSWAEFYGDILLVAAKTGLQFIDAFSSISSTRSHILKDIKYLYEDKPPLERQFRESVREVRMINEMDNKGE